MTFRLSFSHSIAGLSLACAGCEEPVRSELLVVTPHPDAGGEDAGDAGDGANAEDAGERPDVGEPELILYGKCVFDPNDVYLSGTLDAEDMSKSVLIRVDEPGDICFWGGNTARGFVRPTDGAFVYAADDSMRTLIPEQATMRNVTGGWVLPDALANDTTEPLPCFGGAFFGTPEGGYLSSCWDQNLKAEIWYDDETDIPDASLILAAGKNGLRAGTFGGATVALLKKDGTLVAIDGLSVGHTAVAAARSHADGFWFAVNGGDGLERWFVSAKGVAEKEGTFSTLPAGSWPAAGKLDGDGKLYFVGNVEGVVARTDITPKSAMLVYKQSNAPKWAPVDLTTTPPRFYALMKYAELFTGP